MVKKAKKAKKGKKAKKAKKQTQKKKLITPLTPSALKKLGATPFAAATATAAAASSPTHKTGSAIVAPGVNGTTIVCFFNPNTGNFDDCHTVQGTVGIA